MGRLFKRQDRERERRDELLSAYLDGRLTAEEHARLEAQLASDPALRAELEALRRSVALVRSLPRVPAPRNFILPQTIAARPRLAPAARSRRALAPLLTVATSITALLFVAVLSGNLSATTGGRFARAPASPEEQPVVVATVPVERQDMEVSATLPVLAMVAPTGEAVEAAGEGERQSGGTPPVMPSPALAAPAAEGGAFAPAPTADLAVLEEAAALPSPTPTTTAGVIVYGASPAPTETAEPTLPQEEQGEAVRAASEWPDQETGATRRSVSSPWRALEIALGLTALALGVATIWAWRARR